MLGLPKTTELSKQLPKKAIYAKFQMNSAAKDRMDNDISKITIVNELSPARINISAGKEIQSIFVLHIILKRKDFDERNIVTISKLIPQNMLLVLECGQEAKLAVYHTKLIQTEWENKESLSIEIKGLDFDKVWENIITQIGNIEIEQGSSLDEQISRNERIEKLEKEIAKLEKKARAEKQPKKKFGIVSQIKALKSQLKI